MYAIIATGGKQYKVSEGDVLKVEKLNAAEGDTVTFDQVIAVSDNGLKAGADVASATVSATVVGEGKERKSSFTSIRENPVIIRKMVTDSLTHRLRLKRSTLNQKS